MSRVYNTRVFFFKQKTAYEMRISDWSSDVCSSDLLSAHRAPGGRGNARRPDARRHPLHDAPAAPRRLAAELGADPRALRGDRQPRLLQRHRGMNPPRPWPSTANGQRAATMEGKMQKSFWQSKTEIGRAHV